MARWPFGTGVSRSMTLAGSLSACSDEGSSLRTHSACIAAAQPCLDLLRLAAQLADQHHTGLVHLLAALSADDDRDGNSAAVLSALETLASTLSVVVDEARARASYARDAYDSRLLPLDMTKDAKKWSEGGGSVGVVVRAGRVVSDDFSASEDEVVGVGRKVGTTDVGGVVVNGGPEVLTGDALEERPMVIPRVVGEHSGVDVGSLREGRTVCVLARGGSCVSVMEDEAAEAELSAVASLPPSRPDTPSSTISVESMSSSSSSASACASDPASAAAAVNRSSHTHSTPLSSGVLAHRGQPPPQSSSPRCHPTPHTPLSPTITASVLTTTTTTTTTTTISKMRRDTHTRCPSARSTVLSDQYLLQHILSFFCGRGKGLAGVMGAVGCVCQHWLDVSRQESLWRPIAVGTLPILGCESACVSAARERAGGYRAYLKIYGQSLIHPCVRMGDSLDGLRMHFEIWDGMDGLHMLSASGAASAVYNVDHKGTMVRLACAARTEVVGPAFSAVSRDPKRRRYASVTDFLGRCHRDTMPTQLCVRVLVSHHKSGKMALLWQSGKATRYKCVAPDGYWQQFLPSGAVVVTPRDWMRLDGLAGMSIEAKVGFFVYPDPGQEGGEGSTRSDAERRWRVAGADSDHYARHRSFVGLGFNTDLTATVRFLWSVIRAA